MKTFLSSKFSRKLLNLFVFSALTLSLIGQNGQTVRAAPLNPAPCGNGSIFMWTDANVITRAYWPEDCNIQLNVDDPSTPVLPDYSQTTTGQFDLNNPGGIKVIPGFLLSMTDGYLSKYLTVAPLVMKDVSVENDTITGTSEPGTELAVCTYATMSCSFTTTDGSGNWIKDFTTGDLIYDIVPGSAGHVWVNDGDGDLTLVRWSVPYRSYYLKASAEDDWVHAYGWNSGVNLTLKVGEPGDPDYFLTSVSTGNPPWNSISPVEDVVGVFDLNGAYDLQPGDEITVTGDVHTETYTVPTGMTQVRWFIGTGGGGDVSQIPGEQAVVDAYNITHAGTELITEIFPSSAGRDALQAEFDQGKGPDLVGPMGWISSNTFHGQWLDLAPFIASSGFDTSQFDPTMVNWYNTEEGQVGLPFALYPSAIYYNPALFTAAGLNPPPSHYGDQYEMPDHSLVDWSWDTLSQVGRWLTLDASGNNSTEAGFDRNNIIQYGFSFGWEGHPNYWGAFWHGGTLVSGSGPYTAVIPPVWQEAWAWYQDAVWGDQPFIPSGNAAGGMNGGNVFDSGQVAMLDNPSWYMCCISGLTGGGGTFQFGAMPTYNGEVGGRVDADTFRLWKNTTHPEEAFDVLAYLITDASIDLLNVYGAPIPARIADRPAFLADKAAQFPFITTDSWNVLMAGVNYPDDPSAEGWMPNITEAWNRIQSFGDQVSGNSSAVLEVEESLLVEDLYFIFNGLPIPPHPYIQVDLNGRWINGRGWPKDSDVTLMIDDPSNGPGIDHTETSPMVQAPWNPGDPNDILAFFNWPSIGVNPGFILTMSGAGPTKTLTVPDFQVTGSDYETNIIAGEAPAGTKVHVCTNTNNGCAMKHVTAGVDGAWAADYSTMMDLWPGSNGWAVQYDNDRDMTQVDWGTLNPRIQVRANWDQIEAWDWPQGATVTLKIWTDGDDTHDPDYTNTLVLVADPNNSSVSYINLGGVFDIQANALVSLSNGDITKTLSVTNLAFTSWDLDLDTVTGIAPPNIRVDIWACIYNNCYNRHLTADGEGHWTADFAHPGPGGDEQDIVNLIQGTWVDSDTWDEDGDLTMFGIGLPSPHIEVAPYSHWVQAREWPKGTLLTLTVDDPSNGVGVDYTTTATMEQAPWNPGDPNDIVANFAWPESLGLQAGFLLNVSGGGTARSYTIQPLQYDEINLAADTVSGTGVEGHSLHACVNMPNYCVNRYIVVGEDGRWTADYGHPGAQSDEQETVDLRNGSNGWIYDSDQYGNRTMLDWRAPNPNFHVRANWDVLEGWEWGLGDTVTVKIWDDSDIQHEPDYETSFTVPEDPNNPGQTYFSIQTEGYDILSGAVVNVSDGVTSKTLVVSNLAFTSYNLILDTVSGTASSNARVDLWICTDHCGYNRHVTADEDGNWTADFSEPGPQEDESETIDLVHDTWVDSNEWDDDGDATSFGENIPVSLYKIYLPTVAKHPTQPVQPVSKPSRMIS